MSDREEEKNIEQIGEEARASEAAAEETEEVASDEVTPAPVIQPPAPPPPPARKRGVSSVIAWLALLLGVALAAAAGWSFLELERREAALLQRLGDVEVLAGSRDDRLGELRQQWQRELRSGLEELRAGAESRTGQLAALEGELAELRGELARFSAADRDSWLMAEAEYLLRLANQRLIMAGDAGSARALLASADNILRELEDPALHEVRGAVAADLAAVRAVPAIDVEGIYLRLAALIEQADRLVIFQMPEAEPRLEEPAADTWADRLRQGYRSALGKLSDYIVIRRRDVPMQALMDPQWEGLVRQNLRMLLEQAQVALLSGNQALYVESLGRANHWVAQFFDSDETAARAMAREIGQLGDVRIAVAMPDLSRSLGALDEAIQRRLEQGAGH